MSPFEKLEGMVALMGRRIEVIEGQVAALTAGNADELAAQRVAQTIGFAATILELPGGVLERSQKIALAKALRKEGWSAARIARVLRTGERNVERWGAEGKAEGRRLKAEGEKKA